MSDKKKNSEFGRFETLNHWRNRLAVLEVSSSARLVWYVLWSHADQGGICSLSYRRISADTGLSLRTCKYTVKELTEKSIIKIVTSGNLQGDVNTYAIAVIKKKQPKT